MTGSPARRIPSADAAHRPAVGHRHIAKRVRARAETNLIIIELPEDGPDAATVVERARNAGVLVFAFAPRRVRAVTHLDVTADQCRRAADILARAMTPTN